MFWECTRYAKERYSEHVVEQTASKYHCCYFNMHGGPAEGAAV